MLIIWCWKTVPIIQARDVEIGCLISLNEGCYVFSTLWSIEWETANILCHKIPLLLFSIWENTAFSRMKFIIITKSLILKPILILIWAILVFNRIIVHISLSPTKDVYYKMINILRWCNDLNFHDSITTFKIVKFVIFHGFLSRKFYTHTDTVGGA